MAIYFFDTSALVKRYHKEEGSEKVEKIFENQDNIVVIANITLSEMTSAFLKKYNLQEINEEDLRKTISKFSEEIISNFWIIDIERNHINISQDFILKYNLRTLDSIQLAVLLNLKSLNPIFVCSDIDLTNSAEDEGIKVLNPEE